MEVVITCGHPFSGYQQVHHLLESAGVSAANPSPRDSMRAQDLHDGITGVLGRASVDAETIAPMSPGKLWQGLATDFLNANLSNETWGWADARSTWLLDFWSQLAAQIRFVLVYASPAHGIADMLVNGGYLLEALPNMVSDWVRWNSELLHFSARHPERCFLVNSTALDRPEQLIDSINLTLNLNLVGTSDGPRNTDGSADEIAATLVTGMIEEFHEALSLYRQLESAANIEEPAEILPISRKLQVWNDYMARLARERRAEDLLIEHSSVIEVLERERRSYADSSARTRMELEAETAKLRDAVAAEASKQEAIAQYRASRDVLAEENELVFLQLNQVQDALDQTAARAAAFELERDRAITQVRELSATATDGINSELADVTVDMRREIVGKNWYAAESDGRWAGPETISTICLPAMGHGKYKLEIEVVDTMDPAILHSMEVSLCGERVTLSKAGRSYPTIISGDAVRRSAPGSKTWDVQLRFSGLISPAEHGSDDKRLLAVRIRSMRLRLLNENSRGLASPR